MKQAISIVFFFAIGWIGTDIARDQYKTVQYNAYVHGCKENNQTTNTDCHLAANKYLKAK